MSQKINAKNLTYSQNLPPFLAALRDQVSGQTGPDPILAARRRPVKKRSASEEAEDAPLVLDEHGDVVVGVSVGVDGTAAMTAGLSENLEQRQLKEDGLERQEGNLGEGVAGIGTGKKRKVGKIVGGEGEGEEEGAHEYGQREREKSTPQRGSEKKVVSNAKDKADGDRGAAKEKKNKKKSKKIKLSFEDDDVAA